MEEQVTCPGCPYCERRSHPILTFLAGLVCCAILVSAVVSGVALKFAVGFAAALALWVSLGLLALWAVRLGRWLIFFFDTDSELH